MIRIRFTDLVTKKRALGRLAGRFPFKSWATGEMLVPEQRWAFWPPRTYLSRSRAPPRMSRSLRRHQVLLPLGFNDGEPAELREETYPRNLVLGWFSMSLCRVCMML